MVDMGIRRVRIAREERGRGHVLAGLAVAALNDLLIEPGLLDLGAGGRRADSLDGRDLRGAKSVYRSDTGAGCGAIHMDGAGAAERLPTSELRTGHAEYVA